MLVGIEEATPCIGFISIAVAYCQMFKSMIAELIV